MRAPYSFGEYLGLVAAFLAWVVIGLCVAINPWFVFTRDAFSDLGGPSANHPSLYNYGLMAVAALVFLYALYLLQIASNKAEAVACSFVMVAAIFLALIGYFHEGTYPHRFVSTWFFVQFDLAILVSSIGLYLRGHRRAGLGVLLLFVVGTAVAAAVHWPSAATIEAWGIAVIDVWAITVFLTYRGAAGGRPERAAAST